MSKRLRDQEAQPDVEELCSEVKRLQTGVGSQADWGAAHLGQHPPGLATSELHETGSSGPHAAASSGQSGIDPGHEHEDAWLVYHEFNLMLGQLHLQRMQRQAQQG